MEGEYIWSIYRVYMEYISGIYMYILCLYIQDMGYIGSIKDIFVVVYLLEYISLYLSHLHIYTF